MKPEFVNIAGYKFVPLDQLAKRRATLLDIARSAELKGTILLAPEGINLFLAGSREGIDTMIAHLRSHRELVDLAVKESISDHQPFSRMLVRVKKEIISMGVPSIRPSERTSPKLSPRQLKAWLDAGKDFTLLDVRNEFEVDVGTFAQATRIGIEHFREFPQASTRLSDDIKGKPVVMFCTGGIRCEKAGPLMEQQGFEQIYQLDGGILKYFEECGGAHYDGDCFVFDKRVSVGPDLEEGGFEQCYNCRAIVDSEQQKSATYDPPHSCPACFQSEAQRLDARLKERNAAIRAATTPLPGSVPYNNVRPLNVPLRFDRKPAIDFLCGVHADLTEQYWREQCDARRIVYKGSPLDATQIVRSGWQVEHHTPQTTEPDVNSDIRFLYEDDDLIVVDKPAPLPMHASGRFNRNTLINFVRAVVSAEPVRILHRLDANTSGVVVLAKKKASARAVHHQFRNGEVIKTYLARVVGSPAWTDFTCDAPISKQTATAGSRTIAAVDDAGLTARTEFAVRSRFDDGTALVECRPRTGRTHQIRLHLRHLGVPIVGDPTYNGADEPTGESLSLSDAPMCLHAWKLQLRHPASNQTMSFEAGPPQWAGPPQDSRVSTES